MMKDVDFTPGDTIYQLKGDSGSPFLKRNLTALFGDRKRKAQFRLIGEKYYELYYKNKHESYLVRSKIEAKKRHATKFPVFPDQADLKGNSKKISYNIVRLSKRVVAKLKENPQNLFGEAHRIDTAYRELHLDIPRIQAFDGIPNWNVFVQLLDSIVLHQSVDHFELLLAAIFQYAKRCGYG